MLLLPLFAFPQAEKPYRSIIIDSVKALNGGRIDVKDTLLLDSLAVYNTDLSSQYTSRSLVDSAFVGTAMSGNNTIYSADDNLAGNRIVTMGVNSLTFSGNLTTFQGRDATSVNDVSVWEDNVATKLMILQNNGALLVNALTQSFDAKLTIEAIGVGISVKATDNTGNILIGLNSASATIHNMRIVSGIGIYTIGAVRLGTDFSLFPNLSIGGSIAAEGGYTFEQRGNTLIRTNIVVTDGALLNSPDFDLAAKYDSDPTAGITSTDFIAQLQTIVTVGGASPVGRLAFSVDGNEHLSINQDGNVGIGTDSPAVSAILDITTTTGAVLFPRMTTAQRDALTAVNGMVIYNSTLDKLQVRAGGAWISLH